MKKILTLLALTTFLLSAKTLVTVNGHQITDSLLDQSYNNLDETQKSNLLEQLIKEEVIYANLLNSSIVNNAKFQEAFSQQKNVVEQQYGKALNAEQLRSIKGSIAVSLYQQQEFQKATVSANESKNFYQENKDKFVFPNSIEIANIIIKDQATANKILKSLQSSTNLEQDFIKAANAQKQNGYMGWFGRESMPANLFDKAYKYKVKRLINAPVKTKHGYNVVYLLNKKKAGKLSYAEAQPKIEQMLKQKKVMEKLKSKMENLYGNAQIVY
ncbi:MAG: Peptidylprolyl isomerase [uncultured Sulfurovum sp.]|uniref:peptidylprolyl isomerase n=1 Tax=uncultured Sulfurovum sp. TaxID=269237 RepID=A0A6S6TQL6_9BACT|nr:MAG: Peptidylprolyl isomerase [uncultured Sulfurovum sp.]